MLFLIVQRTLARDRFEVLVETGEVRKTALKTKLLDADPVIDEQFAGMTDPDLGDEPGISLACPRFKIPAKRIWRQAGYRCNIGQIDLLCKMLHGMIVDGIDPVILRITQVMPEPGRGQYTLVFRSGKGR